MLQPQNSEPGLGAWLKRLVTTILLVVVFISGYSLGTAQTSADLWQPGAEPADLTTFWQVWSKIKTDYVDQPVDDQALIEGATEGLVWALEDPYSTYFTADQAAEFNAALEGTFSGIGAEIGERDGGITVVAPLPDSPAAAAGLLTGDIIAAIDDVTTVGLSADEAVQRIRGEEGTTVTLTIIRGTAEPFAVAIVRAQIVIKSVTAEIRSDGLAVVTLSIFNEDTVPLFAAAVAELTDAKVKGLVLDLRGDPGGLMTAAIDVAAFWTGTRPVMIEAFADNQVAHAGHGRAVLASLPTVVLINGGSASASEILAGALQDYGLGVIMGETSFGKGSVQEYEQLPHGAALKVTIARWLTPTGRTIHEVGITPDIEVKETLEQIHAGQTPQMDAAISYLTQN